MCARVGEMKDRNKLGLSGGNSINVANPNPQSIMDLLSVIYLSIEAQQ